MTGHDMQIWAVLTLSHFLVGLIAYNYAKIKWSKITWSYAIKIAFRRCLTIESYYLPIEESDEYTLGLKEGIDDCALAIESLDHDFHIYFNKIDSETKMETSS